MSTKKISPSTSMLPIERKNIALLGIANGISLFGSSIYTFAIGLYVLSHTGSGISYALTLFMNLLSALLFTPLAGILADSIPRKRILILANCIGASFLLLLLLTISEKNFPLILIYFITFSLTGAITFSNIAAEASKPNLVSSTSVLKMNSILKVVDSASSTLGPILGGIVFALLPIRIFIGISLLTFLVSAILQCFLSYSFHSEASDMETAIEETSDETTDLVKEDVKKKSTLFSDLKEGANYLKNRKELKQLVFILVLLNFFLALSTTVPMPYLLIQVLGLSSKTLGLVEGAIPIGMILGAVTIRFLLKKYSYETILLRSTLLLAITMLLLGISVFFPFSVEKELLYRLYFIGIMLVSGIALSYIDIPIFNIMALTIPDEIRGRVVSLGICLAKIVTPLALLLSGALVSNTPPFLLPVIGGVLLGVITLGLLYKAKHKQSVPKELLS